VFIRKKEREYKVLASVYFIICVGKKKASVGTHYLFSSQVTHHYSYSMPHGLKNKIKMKENILATNND
jgi:hypothetical protein